MKFVVTLPKIESTNNAHKLGQKGMKAWIYLNPDVVKMQTKIKELLQRQGINDVLKDDPEKCYKLSLAFKLNTNYWRRDTSNMFKYVEDGIMKATGIDDSQTVAIESRKVQTKEPEETIIIDIEVMDKAEWLKGEGHDG